jgi:hypothetical protein
MNIDWLRNLIFDRISDPIAHLGCAGPPECTFPDCKSEGEHDTFLSMTSGKIEVQIDDQEFEIHVRKLPRTMGWSRKDLNLDA